MTTTIDDDVLILSDHDEEDRASNAAATAASSDLVKDYLRRIGKVALLSAEQEVELARRIEAGLFAAESLGTDAKAPSADVRAELKWLAEDGMRAKNHLLEANLRLHAAFAERGAAHSPMRRGRRLRALRSTPLAACLVAALSVGAHSTA
ncbi:sigma-70 factor domain-containing protein [Streptosporangium minutum]|uniref:sigma-70 factor domain-containing protein n=1 Tax=Streptosporangium minutum TaxID=569862 RepID=UPI001F6035C8|nr:sigma-70 factor domain-containing protein [Streptosporangium minutum]